MTMPLLRRSLVKERGAGHDSTVVQHSHRPHRARTFSPIPLLPIRPHPSSADAPGADRVKDAPVSQVLAQMSKQTDIELTADEDIGGKKLTLQVEDVPVLQALARLVKLTGAVIYWDSEEPSH